MNDNPLTKYYRQPAVYIKLPSEGKYWKPGSINLPPNGELPVLPMNGKDDLTMRNADGLMNGASTVSMIQSCVPSIVDAWSTPTIDLDKLLIAIRIASYGNTMSFETKCSECNEILPYEVDLPTIMETIKMPDYTTPVLIGDLMIWFKPNNYKDMNDASQENYIQQRTIKALQSSTMSEEEKIEKFKEAVVELTANTVAKLANFIDYIITPDGAKVTDRTQISEFIENADQKTFTAVKDAIGAIASNYSIPPVRIKCDKCHHEDTRTFQFEPSNFFV